MLVVTVLYITIVLFPTGVNSSETGLNFRNWAQIIKLNDIATDRDFDDLSDTDNSSSLARTLCFFFFARTFSERLVGRDEA